MIGLSHESNLEPWQVPVALNRIVLAEDSASDARLLQEALADGGSTADVLVEQTLSGALLLIAKGDVDLLLLDLGLPDSNGLPTLRAALMHAPDVPVVVMTGADDERSAQQALKEGAQDYLVKGEYQGTVAGGKAVVRSLRYAIERHRFHRELREASHARELFVAAASHELRTPVTIIRDYADLLNDGVAGALPPLGKECVDGILRSSERLRGLVGDLLAVAKIECGALDIQIKRSDLVALLSQARQDFFHAFESKKQQLVLELDEHLPEILCDPNRVSQVVGNLLSNAHRFTPEGGTISIRARRQGDQVAVEVEDTGPGIAPGDSKRAFEPFVQLGRVSGPGSQGTGLGLYIAKQIVTMHAGALELESELGRGSRFTFTLPTAVHCPGLLALHAHLTARLRFTPRHVQATTAVIWFGVIETSASDPAHARTLLQRTARGAEVLFRLHDAAFLCDVDRRVAIVLQGDDASARAFVGRFAQRLPDLSAHLTYHVSLVVPTSPERGAVPPPANAFEPLWAVLPQSLEVKNEH